MKKSLLAVLVLTFMAAVSSASADNVYVYGGVGQTTGSNDKSALDGEVASVGASGFTSTLSSPTVAKLQLGFQVNPNFAIEGGYLGSTNETYQASGGNLNGIVTATAKIDGISISAVAIAPMSDGFSLFAKLGLADTKEKATGTLTAAIRSFANSGITNVSYDESKTGATYGGGVQYDFNKAVFMRAELENYTVGSSGGSGHVTIWAIDVGYKF